jgi:hypothetical protein
VHFETPAPCAAAAEEPPETPPSPDLGGDRDAVLADWLSDAAEAGD